MIIGVFLLSIIAFLGVFLYKRPRLERRVIKRIPLIDWINVLVIPVILYGCVALITRNILSRAERQILQVDDFSLLALGFLFLVYTFVGNSLHFTGKVLSRYIPVDKKSLVFQVNEIFHGNLSHYLVYLGVLLVIFTLALLEINHPVYATWGQKISMLIFSGLLFGFSGARAVLDPVKNYRQKYHIPTFILTALLCSFLWAIYRNFDLNLSFYPVNLFVITSLLSVIILIIMRQFFTLLKLGKRKKLNFIARILSV